MRPIETCSTYICSTQYIDPDSLASTLLYLVGDHIVVADSVSHYLTAEKTSIGKVYIGIGP